MTSRLQRWFLFFALSTCAAWAGGCLVMGRPAWSPLLAGIILGGHASILWLEFALSALISGSRASVIIRLPLAWIHEVAADLVVFCWLQPFCSKSEMDALVVGAADRRGVILVHGLLCNRGFWNPWMKRLRRCGDIPFSAVDLEPPFCSIDEYLATLDAAVNRMFAATGMAPLIVGHSMGGLVARRWAQQQTRDDRFHNIVTIGTPHAGTWLARFAGTRNGRQMAIGSNWLQLLEGSRRPNLEKRFVCFYGDCDNIVFPVRCGMLSGADNRLLTGKGHVQLAFEPEVFKATMDLLQTHPASAGPA